MKTKIVVRISIILETLEKAVCFKREIEIENKTESLERSLNMMVEDNDEKRKRIDYLWSVARKHYTDRLMAKKVFSRMNALSRERSNSY
jgi:hypothetical protein